MNKFKVGDKVILIEGEIVNGIPPEDMAAIIGKVGTVVEDNSVPYVMYHRKIAVVEDKLESASPRPDFQALALKMSRAKSIDRVRAIYKKAVKK